MQHKQNGGLQNLSLSEIHSRETSPPMKSPPLAAANRGKASHLMTASQPKPQKQNGKCKPTPQKPSGVAYSPMMYPQQMTASKRIN